ncbi:hypothetical protein [Clostridium tagluense]|uniref:hypothetical protein n=1 Tax=Clostridium tagluense TaxID=360422 RepID=UPI001CF10B04|nr:hypothetical protein [Clostridium tagluense]MCB2298884.1 hypothetical protein [Clostridium tagluense]
MQEVEIENEMRIIGKKMYGELKEKGKINYEKFIMLSYPDFYKWDKGKKQVILTPGGLSRIITCERRAMPDTFSAIQVSFLRAGTDKEDVKKILKLYMDFYGLTFLIELLKYE